MKIADALKYFNLLGPRVAKIRGETEECEVFGFDARNYTVLCDRIQAWEWVPIGEIQYIKDGKLSGISG